MERKPLIGIDTNVLLRFTLGDDAVQAAQAREFFCALTPRNSGYLSLLVLSEFAWTLARLYKFRRAEIGDKIEEILGVTVFEIERPVIVQKALQLYRQSSADFGDCCIAALSNAAGCTHTYTFNKATAKLPGMRLLGASQA